MSCANKKEEAAAGEGKKEDMSSLLASVAELPFCFLV